MKLYSSHFKNRTTAKTFTSEPKHENPRQVINLARFIITTNNINNIPITAEDRRFAVIECSANLKNDIEYFERLAILWSSLKVRRSTYLFLDALDLTAFSPEKDRPNNNLIKSLKTDKLDPIVEFLMGISLWFAKD